MMLKREKSSLKGRLLLKLALQLPAIIMEDNSAVITITTDDTAEGSTKEPNAGQ